MQTFMQSFFTNTQSFQVASGESLQKFLQRLILKHTKQWYRAAVIHMGVLQTIKELISNFDIAHLATELRTIMEFL